MDATSKIYVDRENVKVKTYADRQNAKVKAYVDEQRVVPASINYFDYLTEGDYSVNEGIAVFLMAQSDRYFKKYHNEKDALFSLSTSGPAIITTVLGKLNKPVYSIRVDLIGKVQKNRITASMTGRDCNVGFDTSESFIGQLSIHAIIRPRLPEVSSIISLDIHHELKHSPIAMYLYGIEGETARVSPYIADSKTVDSDGFFRRGADLDMDYRRIIDLGAPVDHGDACNKKYVDDEVAAKPSHHVVLSQNSALESTNYFRFQDSDITVLSGFTSLKYKERGVSFTKRWHEQDKFLRGGVISSIVAIFRFSLGRISS